MGPMKAMSVMAWRATRLKSGKVARASTDKMPARRLTKRATGRYTPRSASSAIRQKGRRKAHSGRDESANVPADSPLPPMPNTFMDRLISQNVSTGLDQKFSVSRGEPGQYRLMKSFRRAIWRPTSP